MNTLTGHIFECLGVNNFRIIPNDWILPKNKILLRPISVGICSSDYSRLFNGSAYSYPITLGHEIYAEIISNSSKLDFLRGEKVAVFPLVPCNACENCFNLKYNLCDSYSYLGSREPGALGSFLIVSPWQLKKIPCELPNRVGNQVEPLSVVNHAFNQLSNVVRDSKLLLTGTGFLTFLAIQVALLRGIRKITVLSNNDWGSTFLGKYCAVVTHEQISKVDFDMCIDFSGNYQTLDRITSSIKGRGEIILVANKRSDTYISSYSWDKILRKEIFLKGIWNSSFLGPTSEDDWSQSISQLIGSQIKDEYPHREILLTELPKYLLSVKNLGVSSIKNRLSINID